jgi:hypothetical protein
MTETGVTLVESKILTLRGQRVILDADLASLYGVETKRLNEQVRRNSARFPEDFAFLLTHEEVAHLKSQFATSSVGHRGKPTRLPQQIGFTVRERRARYRARTS